jgi:hypothetical protein
MSRASRRAGMEVTLEGLEADFRRVLIDACGRRAAPEGRIYRVLYVPGVDGA